MIDKLRVVLAGKLPPGSFIRNVVTLMTGTTFAQALMILVAPILTRSYSPEDFGVYALYTSIASILTVLACWSYDYAIVLPEHDEDAANILGLSILICLGMAGLTLIIVTFLRYPLTEILNAPGLTIWLWCMPLSVLGAGLFKAFNYWSTRRKHFKRLAVRQVTQSTITSATQIGAGITLNTGPGGLIGGLIVGQLAATGRLAWQIGKDEGKVLISYISIQKLKQIALRYKKFPLYDSWSSLFNTASTMLPALLLGYFFTPAVVGYYALGNRVLAMPMNVIGGSIAQVFFPRATQAQHDGELSRVTLDMFERLLAIGFVPVMLIALVAPDLFSLVFGEKWRVAGQYARWMSLWLLFVFVSSPLSTMYYVKERQKDGLIINFIMFSSRLLVLVIGGIKGDALFTIALFGITGAVLWIVNCVYILYLADVPGLRTFSAILKQVTEGVPYAILPLMAWHIYGNTISFVLAGVGAGIIFLIIMAVKIKKSGTLI
jgi:O-antigen/teichoic acid export membrane protein